MACMEKLYQGFCLELGDLTAVQKGHMIMRKLNTERYVFVPQVSPSFMTMMKSNHVAKIVSKLLIGYFYPEVKSHSHAFSSTLVHSSPKEVSQQRHEMINCSSSGEICCSCSCLSSCQDLGRVVIIWERPNCMFQSRCLM